MPGSDSTVPIRAVTRGPKHHYFGYYDKSQFDPSGRYLLALEVDFLTRPPQPDDVAVIGCVDTADGDAWTPVAETRAFNWQQGTMLHWLPQGRRFVHNDRIDGRFVSVVRDLDARDWRLLPMPVYNVSKDGRQAVTLNFARVHRTRPGYGYCGLPDAGQGVPAPADDGLWWMDMETGDHELIISLAEIIKIRADDTMTDAEHWFNHLLFNPSGTRFIFLHRWTAGRGRWFTRMFTANPDGSDIYCVSDHRIVSHFEWRDDEHILAWAHREESGDHYYLFRDRTEERQTVGEGILTCDGHCSYSPDRRWILTDTYPVKNVRTLILFQPEANRRLDIAHLYAPPELHGEIRCDLHPRWSPDGRFVTLDSAHEKERQVYLLDVADVVLENR